MNAAVDDLWESYCPRLKRYYDHGEFSFLIGAGLSCDSGLPGWDDLNCGLLKRSLLREAKRAPDQGLADPETIVDALYQELGREAATDFVWNRASGTSFFDDLAEILYRGNKVTQLRPGIAYRQIAAMDQARLFTLNFDPLLEIALQECEHESARSNQPKPDSPSPRLFRCTDLASHGNGARRKVCHLHGWVDPDGFRGGAFVLTQSQYFELYTRPGQSANMVLDAVLTSGGAVVIVGMSLTDGNLRRQLYFRSRNQLSDSTEIYAVLKSKGNPGLDTYQAQHWASQGVRLIYIKEWNDIPALLREIKFGLPTEEAGFPWMDKSLAWFTGQLPAARRYSNEWQERAHKGLLGLRTGLADAFKLTPEELANLHISLLGPVSLTEIAFLADTREHRTGDAARAFADNFRLRVSRKHPQGVSGVAFGLGKPLELRGDSAGAFRYFSNEKRDAYAASGLANWSSRVSVPILDSPDFLPVAVVTVESSQTEPFWARLDEGQHQSFYRVLRKAGRALIQKPQP